MDARWDYSHTKGWIFGYKLHIVSSAGSSIIVILSADVTTANIPDNHFYPDLTLSGLHPEIIKKIHYMIADPGYDDQSLYDLSMDLGFELIYPVRRYKNTLHKKDRKRLIFMIRHLNRRYTHKEKYIHRTTYRTHKIVFRIEPLPIKGHDKASAIVLLSVLLYPILVYYNCKTERQKPRTINYLIGY